MLVPTTVYVHSDVKPKVLHPSARPGTTISLTDDTRNPQAAVGARDARCVFVMSLIGQNKLNIFPK